jgi:hypothetical protein
MIWRIIEAFGLDDSFTVEEWCLSESGQEGFYVRDILEATND